MSVNYWYLSAKGDILSGDIDVKDDTLKMILVKNTYTPDTVNHDEYADVSAHEISASGSYSVGGVTVGARTLSLDSTTEEAMLDCSDITITSLTAEDVRYLVFYASKSGNPLLFCCDLEADYDFTGNNVSVQINSDGFVRLQ